MSATEPQSPRRSNGGLAQRVQVTWPLIRLWSVRESRIRYRQSVLDMVWSLLTPIFILAVYGLILTRSFDVSGAGLPYLSFAWAGIVVWTFLASALAQAMPSIVTSADLISKIYFPRETLPLTVVGSYLLDLTIGIGILLVLGSVQGLWPTVTTVAAVPVLAVLVLWTTAISIFLAALTVFLRDVNHGVTVVLRFGFIATPIMYPVVLLPHFLRWTAKVSPPAYVSEALRDATLRQIWPNPVLLLTHLLAASAATVLAMMYVRSVESRMVDVI